MPRITFTAIEVQELYDRLDKIEKLIESDKLKLDDPILSSEQVMKLLCVSRRTLQNWRDNRLITFSAVQNKFFYKLSSIKKMLEDHQVAIEFKPPSKMVKYSGS